MARVGLEEGEDTLAYPQISGKVELAYTQKLDMHINDCRMKHTSLSTLALKLIKLNYVLRFFVEMCNSNIIS